MVPEDKPLKVARVAVTFCAAEPVMPGERESLIWYDVAPRGAFQNSVRCESDRPATRRFFGMPAVPDGAAVTRPSVMLNAVSAVPLDRRAQGQRGRAFAQKMSRIGPLYAMTSRPA